ncbi:universal stress protein [Ramlibacter sp.]|uniref:universal stress protein n=1 Tax=Ramlibacter sp. TaxID=1917967 RepID=UPI003D0EDD56
MKNILIPVTRGDDAHIRAAVAEAARAAALDPALHVHLLSVQPRVTSHVAMFFGRNELSELHDKAGREDLASAEALLGAAGIRHTSHVRVGRSAETIAACARELQCGRVLFGDGHEAQRKMALFGSLAGQVRHLLEGNAGYEVIGS